MSNGNIIILKFGSSVLRDALDYEVAISEIYRHLRRGRRVVAVVSALAGVTDKLLECAQSDVGEPDDSSLAVLLGTGELRCAVGLSLALQRFGIDAVLADHHRLGLRTDGALLHARPISVEVDVALELLERHAVLVVPGFVGVHDDGRTSLLGRGGSDLTAVFLAAQLKADACVSN